jgi:hypothetical protein
LKELLRPTPTTWFNQTTHRVTEQPSAGVSCLACHVNGHTNAAFALAPDSRPNQARLRVDTPPPAPKLDPLMRLIPSLASAQELRGEALFRGKAQCATCHSGPSFVDDYLHDLRVERFYVGRPEGPIKTFPLRNIKDSPPYLHDGRAPTLHDAIQFFDLVLGLGLTRQEKDDLVAYLLCL